MEVQNGFIVGVYNYCDRWCERCPLTARCRLFVDQAKGKFELDRDPLAETTGGRDWRKIRASMEQEGFGLEDPRGAGADGAGWELPAEIRQSTRPDPRVLHNAQALRSKIERARASDQASIRFAVRTIEHFAALVPMKIVRALAGAARGGSRDRTSDANGSAKAALLGLEHMRTAWHILSEAGDVSTADVAPFLAEIASMMACLERALPRARSFVRPGFDEPEAFMKREARERGRRPSGSA